MQNYWLNSKTMKKVLNNVIRCWMLGVRCWVIGVGCWMLAACSTAVENAKLEAARPDIYPDYLGVTVPVNIAPLNFGMADEQAQLIDAIVTDNHGNSLHMR